MSIVLRGRRIAQQYRSVPAQCAVLLLGITAAEACGYEVEAFTEPFRTISVAAPETGILQQIAIREGDEVDAGQVLAELDKDVHVALLAIAKQSMASKGSLDAAMAEAQLRKARLEKFVQLREHGHARQEEVDRARMELEVAEARLTGAQEESLIRKLEYEKIKTQLARRSIRSPTAGLVSEIHKDQGEFVAPNTPEVFTIVQLDPLRATFSVKSAQAGALKVGDEVELRFAQTGNRTKATIEFVAPMTDAESGTVRVKLVIENPQGKYRSGERVSWHLAIGD